MFELLGRRFALGFDPRLEHRVLRCPDFLRLLLSGLLGLLGLANPLSEGSSCRCCGLFADSHFASRETGLSGAFDLSITGTQVPEYSDQRFPRDRGGTCW